MSNIFCLTWSDHDSKSEHYFLAPEGATEENFKNLCDSLLEEAAIEACRVCGRTWDDDPKESLGEEDYFWVGWGSIIQVVARKLLPKHGYNPVNLPTVCYFGPNIIRDRGYDDENELLKNVLETILQYNKKIN